MTTKNASVLEKIKNDTLCPEGAPSHQQALTAIKDLQALETLEGVDPKVVSAAREELVQVVAEYRRTLKVKRGKRKKHTRG